MPIACQYTWSPLGRDRQVQRLDRQQALDRDLDGGLLAYLADRARRRLFARLQAAGGQRPLSAVRPSHQEHPTALVQHDGDDADEGERCVADRGTERDDEGRYGHPRHGTTHPQR